MEERDRQSGMGETTGNASVPSSEDMGRIIDLSGAVGTRTVLIRALPEAVLFDHVQLGARLLLNNAGQSTTVRFDGADGADDKATVEVLGKCGRLTLAQIEHLTIEASGSGRILLDADALRTLIIDGRRPLTIDLSGTMAHLERVDASASEGGIHFTAAEAGALDLSDGSGADRIELSGGRDNRIATGAGADDVATGSGNDVIDLGAGDDKVDAGGGLNVITTGPGRDTIVIGAAGNSSLAEGASLTTVTDFDGEGGDKLWFKFASDGRLADEDALAAIETRIAALNASAGLRDALHAARELTAGGDAGWFVWHGSTYVFVDHPSDPLVLLQSTVPLSAANFVWGE
jgi:Ca2+-binding RTX toxin-like protein